LHGLWQYSDKFDCSDPAIVDIFALFPFRNHSENPKQHADSHGTAKLSTKIPPGNLQASADRA
jgi:hypothetical protein